MYTSRIIFIAFAAVVLVTLSACEDFVQDVDDPINVIEGESIASEDQMPFFMDGVVGRYHVSHDILTVIAGGLSDALEFDSENVRDATFPTFRDIDIGEILPDNNSIAGPYNQIGQARFLAEELLSISADIEFQDADLETQVLYTGNLYSGLAHYTYAAYWGLELTRGGSTLDNGPFVDSSELYQIARDKFQAAITNAPSDYDARVASSLLARTYIYEGNYAAALPFLDAGMQPGDSPFQSQHSLESQNAFNAQAGASRNQYTVNSKYADFIEEDANESARLLIEVLPESEVTAAGVEAGVTIYRQTKYDASANINVMSWQENHLMLAEVDVEAGSGISAVDYINEIRESYGIDPITVNSVDRDLLLQERDKELFLTGNRMIDQRRFDIFHLPDGTWRYFPLTQEERNENPNID